jgi:hypothetical protein
MRKIKWDKDGEYRFLGLGKHGVTGETLLLCNSMGPVVLVFPFLDVGSISRKGMPRNRRFDFVEVNAQKES